MFSQKTVLAAACLPLCLLFSQNVLAQTTFSSKYAPYIGYQHSFTNYTFGDKSVTKYSPRFFMGMNPIQAKNYKMGFELGYTLPVSHEESRLYYSSSYGKGLVRENASISTKANDIYFTFYQTLSSNISPIFFAALKRSPSFDRGRKYLMLARVRAGGCELILYSWRII